MNEKEGYGDGDISEDRDSQSMKNSTWGEEILMKKSNGKFSSEARPKRPISELTAENLSARIRLEPCNARLKTGGRRLAPRGSVSNEDVAFRNVPQPMRKLSLTPDDGEAIHAIFANSIRIGDVDRVANILDNYWPKVIESTFTFYLSFERHVKAVSSFEGEDGDSPDGMVDKIPMTVTAFHLSLLAKRGEIMSLILKKALLEPTQSKKSVLNQLIGSKTSLKFPSVRRDMSVYDKDDRMLDGMNALHIAARYHPKALFTIVELLTSADCLDTLSSFLEVKAKQLEQTPLHYACRSSNNWASSVLLDLGADVGSLDYRGYTPLHTAAKSGSEPNTLLLLEYGADPNVAGFRKKTPLHKARTQNIVKYLLKYDAYPYAKITDKYEPEGPAKHSVFNTLLYRNSQTAEVLLNEGIGTNGHELDSPDLLLVYDLEMFYHESFGDDITESHDEVAGNAKIASLKRDDLLKHPLAETHLSLKWDRIWKLFVLNVFMYTCFVFSLSGLASFQIWMMLRYDEFDGGKAREKCSSVSNYTDPECFFQPVFDHAWAENPDHQRLFYVIYILTFVQCLQLVIRETVQACYSWSYYCRSNEDKLELFLIVTTVSYLVSIFCCPRVVNTHLGCWSIFSAWIEMTMLVGRFPSIGIYVFMFTSVIKTLMHFLLVYSPALLAFSFAFHMLLPHTDVFDNPITASIKVMVMMIGEFEFYGLFSIDSSNKESSTVSTQIMFIAFIVFISIIIMNLLVGLTVNEIGPLKMKAGVVRLEKTVLQIVSIEDVFVHKPTIISWLPRRIQRAINKSTSLFSYLKNANKMKKYWFKVCVRPFPPKPKPTSSSKSWFDTNRDSRKDEYPVYFYNNTRGTIGRPINHELPSWIIENTINLLEKKQETGEMDWMEEEGEQELDTPLHEEPACSHKTSLPAGENADIDPLVSPITEMSEETPFSEAIKENMNKLNEMRMVIDSMMISLEQLQNGSSIRVKVDEPGEEEPQADDEEIEDEHL